MKKTIYVQLFLVAVTICFLTALVNPLPKLFLIGDSISIQYGHHLEKYLQGSFAADVQIYNQKADEICTESKIHVFDLFSASKKLGTSPFIDLLHYKDAARAVYTAYIAGFILCYLNWLLRHKKSFSNQ